MNLLKKFFLKPQVECPRCLGKGNVDADDIRRLNNELKWLPGKCAYCNGRGKVDPSTWSKVSPNNAYLTTDISEKERRKLIAGDPYATERSNYYNEQMETFVKEVEYLYFTGNLKTNVIVDFYFLHQDSEIPAEEYQEIHDYVKKIIELKQRTNFE